MPHKTSTAHRLWFRKRGWVDKIRYESEQVAGAVAADFENAADVAPYKCEVCGFWHLGRRPA